MLYIIVTWKCFMISFIVLAAKFLLNLYAKRRRLTASSGSAPDLVALVGNKNDLEHERMITEEEGRSSAEVSYDTIL